MSSNTSAKKGLKPEKLRAALDPASIPYADSRKIPEKNGYERFQPRAIQALNLALAIKGNEYNIYLAGDSNMGRTYFVQNFLAPAAAKAPTPPDWVYLNNFEDPDRPIAVFLPAGTGRTCKTAMSKVMTALRSDMPTRFEQESYHKRHDILVKRFNKKRDKLFTEMEDKAKDQGFRLDMDDSGALTISPVVEGTVIGDDAFDELPKDVRQKLKSTGDALLTEIGSFLRKINKNERTLKQDELELHKEIAKTVAAEHLDPLKKKFGKFDKLIEHLEAVEKDLVDNVEQFLPKDQPAQQQPGPQFDHQSALDDIFSRYEINLFVDNSKVEGAPVIVEHHPTTFNLLGSIEREAELGALYTDFTLIRAGALHRANHGFLILNTEDLLSSPSSWEGLLRALRAGCSRIEDPVDPDQVRAKTIEPDPIPLDLKIVLIGTDENFEALLYHDDRFQKFFKLKAHLQPTAPRTTSNMRHYVSILGRMVTESGLLPFNRKALAGLVDFASRIAEDQKKLSLYFPLVRERMIEASALAIMDGKKTVDVEHLREAVGTRDFRSNLFEEEYMGDYEREVIKVRTSGEAVGMANGLSVTLFGDYEFGLPHQISCTVGVGHGGILDLEREAQLGGPIHTKGMMIIKSCLVRLFAQDKPLVLTGSLCFEQSYAGIEGDSASGAELAALLSALSGVPIDLSLAFTGAVSQSGAIMAVGGVNRKIEGFFEVCRRRGLTGDQGVLIPADNAVNLMLRDDVVGAVREGMFRIHPVRSIAEAMQLLTGVKVGARGANGKFPKNTLYRKVDDRLAELARLAAPESKDCS